MCWACRLHVLKMIVTWEQLLIITVPFFFFFSVHRFTVFHSFTLYYFFPVDDTRINTNLNKTGMPKRTHWSIIVYRLISTPLGIGPEGVLWLLACACVYTYMSLCVCVCVCVYKQTKTVFYQLCTLVGKTLVSRASQGNDLLAESKDLSHSIFNPKQESFLRRLCGKWQHPRFQLLEARAK